MHFHMVTFIRKQDKLTITKSTKKYEKERETGRKKMNRHRQKEIQWKTANAMRPILPSADHMTPIDTYGT